LLAPADAAIQLQVRVEQTATNTAHGASETSHFLRNTNGINIFEEGVTAELKTGQDPNGAAFDAHIVLDPDYITNNLWFDPDPLSRIAPVPSNRTDAASVFLHELGHIFAFSGWRDVTTGALPADYGSTFDERTFVDASGAYFAGPNAISVHGSAVPLTYGNLYHFGNNLPRAGSSLIPDLMNGIVFFNGKRYGISALDRAVLADVGLSISIPEPASFLTCVIVIGCWINFARLPKQAGTPCRVNVKSCGGNGDSSSAGSVFAHP
jgi:hypothetical protein